VAFDIPAETVRHSLFRNSKTRAVLCEVGQPVTPTIAEATGLKNAAGALVAQVAKQPGGPGRD
jgi:hypothetical protein